MKEFIKRNSKYIVIVMICVFGSYLTMLATNYAFESTDVRFDNSNTEITAGDVQGALEQTFQHVTDYNEIKDTIGSGSLTTTSQTLIGAINGLNDQIGNISNTLGFDTPCIQIKRNINAYSVSFNAAATNWQSGIIIANITGFGNVILTYNFTGSNTASISYLMGNPCGINTITYSTGKITISSSSSYKLHDITIMSN